MATPILPLLADASLRIEERYTRIVIKKDGCWHWRNAPDKHGYGFLSNVGPKGLRIFAHRISYALHFAKDPGDLKVCHKCDNPICTNPDHLFLGTTQDNATDMARKGRSLWGQINPRALISEKDARYILLASSMNMANTELGRLFGMHHSSISALKLGKSWPGLRIEEE